MANTPSITRLRPLFEKAGAEWIEVPVLHPADPFLETAGEDIRRKMFVTEARTGERLALRPDFTIPVCLAHLKRGGAARYAYQGTVFRRHDHGSPERLEAGYEDIGRSDRAAADAEALALALSVARKLGTPKPAVRIGDIALFSALLVALDLPVAWRRRLRRSFGLDAVMNANLDRLSAPRGQEDTRLDPEIRAAADRHDRERLVALLGERLAAHGHSEGAGRGSAEIAERFLDQRALAEGHIEAEQLAVLRDYLALDLDLAEAADALDAFARERGFAFGEALGFFGARTKAIAEVARISGARFAAGFGRPLDYYTGLVFEIGGGEGAAPLVGGGRYDRLMEMLGSREHIPAVGFAVRLDLAQGATA